MYRSKRITRTVRRSMVALGSALLLGACTTWTEAPNPSPFSSRVIRGPLRIVRNDGFSIVLEDVSVRNDSVVGHEAGDDAALVAVALSDVRRTQSQQVEPVKSLGVLLVGAAAAFGAYVYMLITSEST